MGDMVKGSISKSLVAFAVPLVLGNLFQLAYNAVDGMVVGRFAGDGALAAVGTADPVMSLLILGVTGLCIGAGVLMSNFFGAGDYAQLKKELAAMLALGMGLAALILVLGLILSRPVFLLMQVPAEVMPEALLYMRIIFLGMPFTCLYNIYAAALRSIGDARTPTVFLAASCVMNGLLDVLFVAVFHWGVAGAAIATDMAAMASALACVAYTYKRIDLLRLGREDLRPDKSLVGRTVRYGAATALQQCSQPVGKLFIQGMVNSLGVSTMAAFNAVGKIEDFALVPERSLGNAMTTFTAQNDGAGRKDRVRLGLIRGLMLELSYFVFICLVILWLHRPMLGLFSGEAATLDEGSRYFRVMAFFYWLPALTNGIQGFFRGMKHMKVTLFLTLTQISVRVLVTWLLIGSMGITGITYACAAGWTAMLIVAVVYFRRAVYPGLRE